MVSNQPVTPCSSLRYGSGRWSITGKQHFEDNQQRLRRDGSKAWAIGSSECRGGIAEHRMGSPYRGMASTAPGGKLAGMGKGEKGPKIDLCRRWVEELKLKELDPDAKKMKAHVLQMIKKYTAAKKLELSTGFGDLEDMTKVKGKCNGPVVGDLPVVVFKILDAKLGERHANSISATMGIVGKGLRGADMLLDGEGGVSSRSDTPASCATQSRLEERSGDGNSRGTVGVPPSQAFSCLPPKKFHQLDFLIPLSIFVKLL
ncbi:hypothetical protein EV426DRAFT_720468 [Tirmania nivea]|nr:hypothetical protein EV426DRAFT_720468 [Tirmania nivea]